MDYIFSKAIKALPSTLWPNNRYTIMLYNRVQEISNATIHNSENERESNKLNNDILTNPDSGKESLHNSLVSYDAEKYQYLSGDHRIHYLALKAFRGIGIAKKYGLEHYGLMFSSKGTPVSTVILGQNGSRKTTFYSAMELLTIGNISVAVKRGYSEPEKLYEFTRNIQSSKDDPEVVIKTSSNYLKQLLTHELAGKYKILFEELECRPFFCSECDINIFEMSNISIENYIEDLAGFRELNIALKIIKTSENAIKLKYEELKQESAENTNNLEKVNYQVEELNEKLNKVIERFEAEISSYNEKTEPTSLSEIRAEKEKLLKEKEELLKKKEELENSCFLNKTELMSILSRIDWAKDIFKFFNDIKIENKISVFEKIAECAKRIMRIHLLEDADIDIFNSEGVFNGMLFSKSSDEEIDPRNYFNNFRFKIYIISFRIAIALFLMKTYNIRFPLIFDDVFDSSDFKNRARIDDFIEAVSIGYKEIVENDKKLQIIFFTQDEVLANGVFKGLNKTQNSVQLLKLCDIEKVTCNDKVKTQIFIHQILHRNDQINGFVKPYDLVKSAHF